MADKKTNALLMVLGKGKPSSAAMAEDPSKVGVENEDYDADLQTALGDLAASLGVKVVDPQRGVEALRTIHDLCDRASGEGA